jgi:hypothetical protein
MIQFLKVLAACAALVLLVPLFVWGATGSWRHALHALREYGVAMSVICVPVLLFVSADLIGRW